MSTEELAMSYREIVESSFQTSRGVRRLESEGDSEKNDERKKDEWSSQCNSLDQK
jgi:hypothetical protein